jgi:hypothetical protein
LHTIKSCYSLKEQKGKKEAVKERAAMKQKENQLE